MPDMNVADFAVKARLKALDTLSKSGFQAIVIGDKGAGKTSLLRTCVKPVLHMSWDPKGELVLMEKDKDGNLVAPPWLVPVVDYQGNTAADFRQWEKDMVAMIRGNAFRQFGTFCLDSITTWAEALLDKVLSDVAGKPQGKGIHGDKMEIQDWGTFLGEVTKWVKIMLALPCDVIIMGHIQQDKDEITGAIINNLMIPGQSSQRAPIWTSEVYYLRTGSAPGPGQDPPRYLLTRTDGQYRATTRLGAQHLGNFVQREVADIKALKAKAGLPTEDLPYDWEVQQGV